jgi:hypothetical protein
VIPHEAELGKWWAEKAWIATPWVFRSDHPPELPILSAYSAWRWCLKNNTPVL